MSQSVCFLNSCAHLVCTCNSCILAASMYNEDDGAKRKHAKATVYKGDSQYPVPLNMQKLKDAKSQAGVVCQCT